MTTTDAPTPSPLQSLDEWEDFLKAIYPESTQKSEFITNIKREQGEFRDYRKEARPSVKEFYKINHQEPVAKYFPATLRW